MNIYQQHTRAHAVGWSTYHLEWCTKYRYKMFKQDYIKNLCLIGIQEAAKRHRIDLIDLEVDVDHVHVIASLPLTMPPTKALHLLKGVSASLLFRLVPNLRKRYPKGHLWSPGKFAASVGYITVEKAKQYLVDHHAKKTRPYRESPRRSAAKAAAEGRGGRQFHGREILLLCKFHYPKNL